MASSHPEESISSASSMTVNLAYCQYSTIKGRIVYSLEAIERQEIELRHEVKQSSRSGNENIAPHLELLSLQPGGGTTIDDAWTKHGAVAQSTSFIEDLACKLTGWANDKDQRLRTHAIRQWIVANRVRTRGGQETGFAHELRQDGDQVCRSLARAFSALVSSL
jgi:hypothetical protein